MAALLFQSEEALRVALTSGLVPEEIQALPAGIARLADGALAVTPSKPLPKKALEALEKAGVKSGDAAPSRQASCWAEALPPRKTGTDVGPGMVLFEVPKGGSSLDLAAEMLRLGCDRQDHHLPANGGPAFVRAVDPPYYTVASAADRPGGIRAFTPTPPGQERVWTEVGFAHPLANAVQLPVGELLLIARDGHWSRVADGPWSDLYQLLELKLPGEPLARKATPPSKKLQVTLRLARAPRNDAPSLWVLRPTEKSDPIAQIDSLVQNLPDDVLARVLFAAIGDASKPIIVLKARTGKQGPPELVIPAETYIALPGIPNLFVPRDATIEPPLRRERLKDLLAPSPEKIAWLAPLEGSTFRLESLEDVSFSPLSDWVEYLVHSRADALAGWARSAEFEFESFESVGGEWSDGPPKEERERPDREPREKKHRDKHEVEEATPAPKVVRRVKTVPTATSASEELKVVATTPTEAEKELHDLERDFVALDAPADDSARLPLWTHMGALNASLGRGRDAALCWTRAFWEAQGLDAVWIARRWAQAEAGMVEVKQEELVETILAKTSPTRDETRALAAQAVVAQPAVTKDVHRVQVWLDEHDDNLDVRSLWLARTALARLVGGDKLGLARTRDRILAKLSRGLSMERDVPTFLRFTAQPGAAGGAPGANKLAEGLEALLVRFEKTDRKRSAVEAPPALTKSYVQLLFAYGFARIGLGDRARAIRAKALEGLDAKEAIHGFLSRAYAARIDQALESLPPETPLPAPIAGELDGLEKFLRYKVDRLRQASQVLESQERLDPVLAFQRGEKDPRGEEFAGMRAMTDSAKLGTEIDKLMKKAMAKDTPPEETARLFDGLMDFFTILPESQAVPRITAILKSVDGVPPGKRALLLEEALMLAGFFGRSDMVKSIVGSLKKILTTIGGEQATDLGSTLGKSLRTLRRVGLRDEAANLLETLASVVKGTTPAALAARLQLASGLTYLGHLERARPTFEEALGALKAKDLAVGDRLAITRAFAGALSQAPQDYAVAGIAKLAENLPAVTDSFNTNSHFCLSVIAFMESLILGLASEDLALGEFGRRWLDEDEHLVRRRVHREMGEV